MYSWQRFVKTLVLTAAVVVCLAPYGVRLAAQEKSWVGETVLNTKPPKEVKFVDRTGDKEVEYPFSGIWPFQVRAEKDGWLRIHDRRREGWVKKEDFVLAREAIDYFSRRIDANPKDNFALRMRGAAWLQKNQPDNAISDFDACLALNPNDAGAFNNRGLAWHDKKEYDKAVADYSDAIRLDPKPPVYHVNRGLTWRMKNEYDKAIADYDETIRLEPRYALAFHNRGVAWVLKKEYDKGVKDFDHAIQLDPKYPQSFRERGLAYSNLKEYAKALADYEAALGLNPKYAAVLADQAWLLATCPNERYRDGKKAVEAARKACELNDWKVASQLSTLAAAQAEAGDFKEAVHWQNKALEIPEYAKRNGDKARQRLKLYEAGTPYRQD